MNDHRHHSIIVLSAIDLQPAVCRFGKLSVLMGFASAVIPGDSLHELHLEGSLVKSMPRITFRGRHNSNCYRPAHYDEFLGANERTPNRVCGVPASFNLLAPRKRGLGRACPRLVDSGKCLSWRRVSSSPCWANRRDHANQQRSKHQDRDSGPRNGDNGRH